MSGVSEPLSRVKVGTLRRPEGPPEPMVVVPVDVEKEDVRILKVCFYSKVSEGMALQLGCLELRRFFKDMPHNALDKKSNFELLEKEVGLDLFFPKQMQENLKPKQFRKMIQQTFQQYASLREEECVMKFFNTLAGFANIDQETYRCELIQGWNITVDLVIGPKGIRQLTSQDTKPTCLAEFKQIRSIRCLPLEETQAVLQLGIEGAPQSLSIKTSSLAEAENMADLIDGYCRLQGEHKGSLIMHAKKDGEKRNSLPQIPTLNLEARRSHLSESCSIESDIYEEDFIRPSSREEAQQLWEAEKIKMKQVLERQQKQMVEDSQWLRREERCLDPMVYMNDKSPLTPPQTNLLAPKLQFQVPEGLCASSPTLTSPMEYPSPVNSLHTPPLLYSVHWNLFNVSLTWMDSQGP